MAWYGTCGAAAAHSSERWGEIIPDIMRAGEAQRSGLTGGFEEVGDIASGGDGAGGRLGVGDFAAGDGEAGGIGVVGENSFGVVA